MANSLCYYSTNPWIKWYICHEWRNDMHYVWCSEYFSPELLGPDHAGSLTPPTSSPAAIYKDLAGAVRGPFDRHNEKIIKQRSSLLDLVERWRLKGELIGEDADEAIGLLNAEDYFIWRPLLYIIPCSAVAKSRVRRVTAKDRAGPGAEYIIEDLAGHEFERIRFDGI